MSWSLASVLNGHDEVYVITAIALFSCVVPFGIFVGRNNIRIVRLEIVRDLEKLFNFAKRDGQPLILPSFELVKYKYDPESNPYRQGDGLDKNAVRYYLLPVGIYIVLATLCFHMAFMSKPVTLLGLWSLFSRPPPFAEPADSLSGVLTYAFLGSYIWSVKYLVRRIANYDLSPISFFQCNTQILMALFVTAALQNSGLLGVIGGNYRVALAFVIGFFPDLFLTALIAKFPWIRLRRVSPASQALQEELPLDMILGIDPFMKLRLGEFEIEDVQESRHAESDPDIRRNALWPLRGHRLGRAGATHPGRRLKLRGSSARTQHQNDLRSGTGRLQSGRPAGAPENSHQWSLRNRWSRRN